MKTVLLVEDDPFIRDLTSVKLSENGLGVSIAQSGETALELILSQPPDLVLLDLDLPGMSGIEVLKKLKEGPKFEAIPVIIFSNNDDPDIKKETEAFKTEGFFIKASTSFDDLLVHINAVLSK